MPDSIRTSRNRVPGRVDLRLTRFIAAHFARAKEDLVASGWANGEEVLAGRPAVVEATLGKGSVVLFGFHPQHRAQTVGTYKLLFNALYQTTSR